MHHGAPTGHVRATVLWTVLCDLRCGVGVATLLRVFSRHPPRIFTPNALVGTSQPTHLNLGVFLTRATQLGVQEIWNIFTFYSLHGNPLDPEHIRATQFVKLARDCQIVGSSLSEADPPLMDADVQVRSYSVCALRFPRHPHLGSVRRSGTLARRACNVAAE